MADLRGEVNWSGVTTPTQALLSIIVPYEDSVQLYKCCGGSVSTTLLSVLVFLLCCCKVVYKYRPQLRCEWSITEVSLYRLTR